MTTELKKTEIANQFLGGEGAKYVARTLAKQGKQVAVIERRYIGGSCPKKASRSC